MLSNIYLSNFLVENITLSIILYNSPQTVQIYIDITSDVI